MTEEEYHPYPCDRHYLVAFGMMGIFLIVAFMIIIPAFLQFLQMPPPCDCLAGYRCACVDGFTCGGGCYLENGTLIFSSQHCNDGFRGCVKIPPEVENVPLAYEVVRYENGTVEEFYNRVRK